MAATCETISSRRTGSAVHLVPDPTVFDKTQLTLGNFGSSGRKKAVTQQIKPSVPLSVQQRSSKNRNYNLTTTALKQQGNWEADKVLVWFSMSDVTLKQLFILFNASS